jgi:anti-sigma B factor antagonist
MIKIYKEDTNYLFVSLTVKEANLANADSFKAELLKLIDGHSQKIVLDLNTVEYIDSSFLGALVSALKHAISRQSDIILVDLRKDIADLFALIRLDKVFKIYANFNDVPNH